MKLEHCKVEPSGEGSSVNLGFSTPSKLTPELVMDLGRRIDLFLMRKENISNVIVSLRSEGEDSTPAPTGGAVESGMYVDNGTHLGAVIFKEDPSKSYLSDLVFKEVPNETKPSRRGRPAKQEKPEDVASATPPRRTRAPVEAVDGTAVTDPRAPESAEDTPPPPRRTRAPAPEVETVISDIDLAKAASEAAEVIGVAVVKEIISEMGVATVNQIKEQSARKYFLGLLETEMQQVKEEKANAGA